MSNTKNGLPKIKNEWRLIHKTLHDRRFTSLRLGRKVYEILESTNGCRYVDYDNIRFVEQNRRSKSALGRRAAIGERITWCNPHDSHSPAFMIDQNVLLQEVNQAVIYLPVKKRADGRQETTSGISVDSGGSITTAGNGDNEKPAAKRGRRKLGGK
jgi:hypothetical protein